MPVETRNMEHVLATIVEDNKALFNDSALAHIEHSFSGTSFALAGVSSHMATKDLEWLILHCGGTLASHVTKDTDFLVVGTKVGDTMHGVTKVEDLQIFKDAEARGIKSIRTLDFFRLVRLILYSISLQLMHQYHQIM
jgi:NAD-dependent DNA ligase